MYEGWFGMDSTIQNPNMGKKRDMKQKADRLWFPKLSKVEVGYLILCFCIYLFWAMTFTMWEYGPDEYMRFDIPKYIYTNNALPVGSEESIRNPIWGFSYGFDIELPYILEACMMKVMSLFSQEHIPMLIAARLVSVLSTVGVGYFAIVFSKKTMGKSPMRWVFIVLMTLLPQIVFLGSYVNRDVFSLFTVMWILYGWVICLEREWDCSSSCFLAVGLGLCLLSYQFAFSYVLATFFFYISWHLLNRQKRNFKAFMKTGIMILAIVFVLCGWKFIRNAILYDGDFLSLHTNSKYQELYAMEEYKPSVMKSPIENGIGLKTMLIDMSWISMTWKSLIGIFGYMNILLPEGYYRFFGVLLVIGLAGMVLKGIQSAVNNKGEREWMQTPLLIGFWMLFASFVTVCISIRFSWFGSFQPQGRYVIAITPLLFIVIAMGLEQWIELFGDRILRKQKLTWELKVLCSRCFFTFLLSSVFFSYYTCLCVFIYPKG